MIEQGRQEARKELDGVARKLAQKEREKGLLEGKRGTLLRLLSLKFGSVPAEVVKAIRALETADEIGALLDRVLTATTLDEMNLGS